ncbi:unnamed protein product [Rotaria sordida]|uniref:Lipoxygenase domain-containing protein n=1 Tax=Rotaria sordida TaxID=392033 RepID=A0A813VBT8_9BILA|nr:unnamed protein product [Rotaria sordida]CAF0873662.1 unnamed protein product [Rotaria sordida]
MIIIPWTVDQLFNCNNIIIIGWLALIFAPFHKLSKYLIFLSAFLLSLLYTLILLETLFLRNSNNTLLDVSQLSEWFDLLKDPLLVIGTIYHLHIMDLWIGRWMVYDFYSGYSFAYSITNHSNGKYYVNRSWTFGRIIFTLILLTTYIAAPFGFLLYIVAKCTFLTKYKLEDRIDVNNYQDFIEKSQMYHMQTDLFIPHYVRFGDNFPKSLRKIYHFLLGILGLFVLFVVALPVYVVLIIYCRITYRTSSASTQQSNTDSEITPNKRIPDYVRNVTAIIRLKLITTSMTRRNYIWYFKFLLLQLATFIEYILNAPNPHALFHVLEDYFVKVYNLPYFVFGDGIGVGSYELVKRYIQDIPPRKGLESLGWKVSSSQETFCDLTTIFLSSDDPNMKLSRHIIFQWLHAFPHHLFEANYEAQLHLSRIVPRKIDGQPNKHVVYRAVGEVMFYLATNGELRKNERAAFIDCVETPFIFFPNWFNFLLFGHYFERKTLKSYYTLLQAFARYIDGAALHAAFIAADNQKSKSEVLKLITVVFCVAGSVAPSKLAVTVIERLWSNPDKYVHLFRKNPHNFIKECARLDKVVPMVNVLATFDIANEIENKFKKKYENINIYENTPIHCSIVNANRDKTIFQNPENFMPERSDLNKIIVWNGVEEDIINLDKTKRPPRYCPGHDLSLDVIQFVAERFAPPIFDNNDSEKADFSSTIHNPQDDNKSQQLDHLIEKDMIIKSLVSTKSANEIFDENERQWVLSNLNINQFNERDQNCYNALDNYTKIVMLLMQLAINESNSFPPRAIDIRPPFDLPTHDLGMFRIDMAKFVPSWDEDQPNGSPLLRRLVRWLINQNIWGFRDSLIEFDTPEQALAWRSKMFPALPIPNVVYTDMLSDEAMTQLAFAGCACHYTQRVEQREQSGHSIPEGKLLNDAVYVNDMTGLSTFSVRKSFERYGAAAYFDKDFQIIGIYWSHDSRLVKKDDQFWDHAKYVWRSSFFAYITIGDHLISTHMIESNAFVSASRKHLPVDHPLRIFIKPFTYHTVSINYLAALSLVNKGGLVHRIWAFDYDEFLKVCDYISIHYKFRTLPNFIPKSMYPNKNDRTDDEWDKIYPIYHDLNAYWNIIQKYVKNFFKINYNLSIDNGNDHLPNDSYIRNFIYEICKQLGISGITSLQHFIDVLSQLIAASTGIHEHVGQISDYMTDPRFIGAKLQQGKEMQNIQTYSQILVLSVITGLRMPGLLEDWSHLIERNRYYSQNLQNYQTFKKELKELSNDIDSRNKIRKYPFQSFNPKYMECSTSV